MNRQTLRHRVDLRPLPYGADGAGESGMPYRRSLNLDPHTGDGDRASVGKVVETEHRQDQR